MVLPILFTFLVSSFLHFSANSQGCPFNIDFELGNFAGWTCYIGSVSAETGDNEISLTATSGPVLGRHTMFSSFPGDGYDEYGGFPVNCPNGSGHSIKLGNNEGGGLAEGISYEFTIPNGANVYNLIYNYAVVFQDPDHLPFQQPRMEIEITNVTDNKVITCSSFTFFPNGSPLPGFELSPVVIGDAPIWYKKWSAVSINLDGNAGKHIKLFFKTADCTFRRHFGYAYIDVNSECSGSFIGSSYCPDDTEVYVVAPFGYQSYRWFNSTFTQYLGNTQTLVLSPPPAPGTTLAVALEPYNGYGCPDTLFTTLKDNLVVTANAGNDTTSCNHNGVPIGVPPRAEFVYQWSPAVGLSDATISNPVANPDVTTTYVVTTKSRGGGCIQKDTIVVSVSELDNSIELTGSENYCIGNPDPPLLKVLPAADIQWFKNGVAINGATQATYSPTETGTYYAHLSNNTGCILDTDPKSVIISSIPIPGFSVDIPNQCQIGNKFVFTNSSINAVGPMLYQWILGDGTIEYTRDITHVYNNPGTYKVKLIVKSSSICSDSSELTIHVYQNAVPDFIAKPVCINLPAQIINNTADTLGSVINYLWTFDNGQQYNVRNPPVQTYPVEGIHMITLSVSTVQCPTPVLTSSQYLVVEKPKDGIRYADKIAVVDLPLDLQVRPIGETVLWNPPIKLDNPAGFTPIFRSNTEQLYTIEITRQSGCIVVDTQMVKMVKKIEIYVPTAFTPDNDGMNDFLRPTNFGIKKVNYFKVFNRWGQLMYQMTADRPGWDGTLKGVRQEMQTYVWIIEAIGYDGNTYNRKGTTILIR